MEIGFTSTTFRQMKNIEQVVQTAVQAKVNCIEWGGDIHVKSVSEAAKAKALCSDAGIAVSSYGSYYRVGSNDADERRRVCEIAAETGADTVRVWLGTKNSEKTSADEYNILLSDLVALCSDAAEFALKISPECHMNTFNNNTDAFLKIFAAAKAAGVTNLRTYFQSKYKNLPYDLDRIERTINEIGIVHISFSEQMREQAFAKKDSQYSEKLIKKLLECGFDNRILLEYTFFASPKYFIKDIEKLRRLTEGTAEK